MNFQDLKNIETDKTYLDIAFARAKKKLNLLKQKKSIKSKIIRQKELDHARLECIKDTLIVNLLRILKSFPSVDQLPPFYQELIKCTIDYKQLKKSLGSLNWAVDKISDFTKIYTRKISKCDDQNTINSYRKEYYGRISSILRQIKKFLVFLEEARKVMKDYPSIKTSLPTIAIVGFPNVGKTTLLYKLTGSKGEIKSYAFTTVGINQGFVKVKNQKIQILDTPGTLDRFDKMNNVEKIAHLAVKHCAEKLIYVFDVTEPYPLIDQIKLYNEFKKHHKDIWIYLSKTDIIKDKDKKNLKIKAQTTEQLQENINSWNPETALTADPKISQ